MSIAIRAEGLGKRYRLGQRPRYRTLRDTVAGWFGGGGPAPETAHLWALRDATFEVAQGEVIGLVGRNGAGKSTLLKVLARVTAPTEGTAEVHGRLGSLLEVGTGFHPELTGRENVYLSGSILGMRRAEIAQRFDEIVAFSEVEAFLDTPVKHYSSGMQLRLGFAVAAHLAADVLLVDELLAVGDAAFQRKCLGKMRSVAENGRTVVFVSHNLGAVRRLCGRALWLAGGKIELAGDVESVLKAYEATAMAAVGATGRFDRPAEQAPQRDTWVQWMEVRDSRGSLRTTFEYGDSLELTFGLAGKPAPEGMSVSWLMTDSRGNPLAWSASGQTAGVFLKQGQSIIRCRLDNLPLAIDRYFLSASAGLPGIALPRDIWRDAAFFDVARCYPFEVSDEHRAVPFGAVVLPHRWLREGGP